VFLDILVPGCARDRVPGDLPVTTVLAGRPIGPVVIRQIMHGHHNLVVMRPRGRGAVRSALLGSVSHSVLNYSPVHVLIAHGEHQRWDTDAAPHLRGLYLSFDTDQRPERLKEALPGQTLTRLRQLKARYDPGNVFNQNFPIPPATDISRQETPTKDDRQ
jgi:hypothetical protein